MLIPAAARLVVAAASSALAVTVASQCARNMIQTKRVLSDYSSAQELPDWYDPLAETLIRANTEERIPECLQEMNREDLLRVFVAFGRAPTNEDLCDVLCVSSSTEWEGRLLDNNSKIMDLSSNIMTHALFGGIALPWRAGSSKKGLWRGKTFQKPKASTRRGINRFGNSNDDDDEKSLLKDTDESPCFERHAFDYSIEPSKFETNRGSTSIRLLYSNYQSLPISLWHSMVDELRLLDIPKIGTEGDCDADNESSPILIGMGWMGWSGGPLNCAPFMLERIQNNQ